MRKVNPLRLLKWQVGTEATMVRWSPFWRSQNRSNYLICNIDVTAFVGVMLVFLFMFMVQNPVCSFWNHGRAVDLAKVGHPISMAHADREDAMVIGITRENKLFFGPN